MTFHVDATYRAGALHPDQPLNLPENTPVHVVVSRKVAGQPLTREEIIAMRPKSPRITPEELDALLDKHGVSAPSLPPDFSRADIYSDHD